jgi:hypothetical protein
MYRKRRLELWIPVDCFLHREIVQLVCKHYPPGSVKRARSQIAYEQAVVSINSGLGDIVGPNAPVVRVIRPDDSLQAHCICNIANAVLCQQKQKKNICQYCDIQDGEHGTHINIAIGRTPTSRCDASD